MAIDFNDLKANPSVKRAIDDLKAICKRPLIFKHMQDWKNDNPKTLPSPALIAFDDHDEVYLNDTLPAHMAVHELTHAILREECYPVYKFDQSLLARRSPRQDEYQAELNQFHNKLQHPEIYRRMSEVYKLDMNRYVKHVAGELHEQTKGRIKKKMFHDVFGRQAQIFNFIDLLHLKPYSAKTLNLITAEWPSLAITANKADTELRAIGHSTPEQAIAGVRAVWKYVVDYGTRNGNVPTNDLWRVVTWCLPPRAGTAG